MGKDEMAPLLILLPSLFGAILCVTSNTQDSRCAVVLYWLPVSIKTIKMGFFGAMRTDGVGIVGSRRCVFLRTFVIGSCGRGIELFFAYFRSSWSSVSPAATSGKCETVSNVSLCKTGMSGAQTTYH